MIPGEIGMRCPYRRILSLRCVWAVGGTRAVSIPQYKAKFTRLGTSRARGDQFL